MNTTAPKTLTGDALFAKATELVKRALAAFKLGDIRPESLEALRTEACCMSGEPDWDYIARVADISYAKDGLGMRAAYNVFMGRMLELFEPVKPIPPKVQPLRYDVSIKKAADGRETCVWTPAVLYDGRLVRITLPSGNEAVYEIAEAHLTATTALSRPEFIRLHAIQLAHELGGVWYRGVGFSPINDELAVKALRLLPKIEG